MDDQLVTTADMPLETDARRARLAWNLGELSYRMKPKNLVHEGVEHVRVKVKKEAGKIMSQTREAAGAVAYDSLVWASENRRLVAGGAVATIVGAWAVWRVRAARNKTPVPLYAAYAMEDSAMMNDDAQQSKWNRVRDEAANIGAKAGETYYAARSRAASIADNASGYADEAANVARDVAYQAKETACGARDWTARQSREHPVGMLIAGVAAGALVAALLPARRKNNVAVPGQPVREASEAARGAVAGAVAHAKHAYEAVESKLGAADLSPDSLRSHLHDLAGHAADLVAEAGQNAADKLRKI